MLMPSIFENTLESLFDEMDRPSRRPMSSLSTVSGMMKTDVKETDAGYELDIELPGYKKEDIKAELVDGYLTITAETRTESTEGDENEKKYLRRERFYGSCQRRFFVGSEVTKEDIQARFEDGILKMFVPKKEPVAEEPAQNQISIQ